MSSLVELDPASDQFWEFAQWGNKVIAVSGPNNTPQIITMGNTSFTDLSGTPPAAHHIAVVRNFVVMGNIKEGGTAYRNRIRWSGINDETIWTTNKLKQADYQDLLSGGKIQAIRGGEYGVIFMERSIWVMDYIGPPQIFKLDETLPGVGTPAPNSVVQSGDTCYLLSQTGFIAVQNGRALQEIGANKINKWFFDTVDLEYINRVVGVWDRERRILIWIFPSSSTAGLPNNGVIFSLETGKWSRFEDELEWVFQGLGESYTLEGLDAVNTSIDALPYSLDSGNWIDENFTTIAFDDTNKSGLFDSAAMAATLETTEAKIGNDRSLVSRARLEVDAPSVATITPATRNSQSDVVTYSLAISQQAGDGSYPMRSEGRYHRFQVDITGGFTRAQGLTIEDVSETGGR